MLGSRRITLIVVSITLLSLVIVATVSGETFFIYAQNKTKYAAKLIGKSVVPPVNTSAAGSGELRGTIKIQNGNTTTQVASNNNTDDVNSFKNKDSNSTVPTKATSTTTTGLATTTDTISTFGNPNENNLVDELVKTGNFTEAEAREFVTNDMQSENGTNTTSDTNTTSNADTNTADTNTTSNADTNTADTNTTSNADTNTGNRSMSDDTSSTNNEDNNDQSSNNNNNNPRHYDDLDELVNDIKNSDVDTEEISLNAFQDSGAYQGADQETRDCIDLAGKIGHNLGDQEIVNCSEDPSFYKNEISNNNDNNNDNSADDSSNSPDENSDSGNDNNN